MKPFEKQIVDHLRSNIRNVPDFPKPGIQFKDITPLLHNYQTLKLTSMLLSKPFRGCQVDIVAGLEARGFLFGTDLAMNLNAGFVPIRKPNKLPAETTAEVYASEYGTDSLEVHHDAISKGMNVVIHDDLIATGGSAKAATALIRKLGGKVIGYSFVIALEGLGGLDSLPDNIPVNVLINL